MQVSWCSNGSKNALQVRVHHPRANRCCQMVVMGTCNGLRAVVAEGFTQQQFCKMHFLNRDCRHKNSLRSCSEHRSHQRWIWQTCWTAGLRRAKGQRPKGSERPRAKLESNAKGVKNGRLKPCRRHCRIRVKTMWNVVCCLVVNTGFIFMWVVEFGIYVNKILSRIGFQNVSEFLTWVYQPASATTMFRPTLPPYPLPKTAQQMSLPSRILVMNSCINKHIVVLMYCCIYALVTNQTYEI